MSFKLIVDKSETENFRKQLIETSLLNIEEYGIHGVKPGVPLQISYRPEVVAAAASPPNNANEQAPAPPILGGLVGYTSASYLFVQLLWVSEKSRTGGVGRALMMKAEEEARKRGCRTSLVGTFSFQAEAFYIKCGYIPYARLEGGFNHQAESIHFSKSIESSQDAFSIPPAIDKYLFVSETEPPELVPIIIEGLEKHSLATNPNLQFDHYSLGLQQVLQDVTNGARPSGLYATMGGSFLTVVRVGFQANTSEEEKYSLTLEWVREAEKIALERGCNGMTMMVFDFEKGVRRALDAISMAELHVLPNWMDGQATRSYMYKRLRTA